MEPHDQAVADLKRIKAHTFYRHNKIRFISPKEEPSPDVHESKTSKGKDVAAFYRSLTHRDRPSSEAIQFQTNSVPYESTDHSEDINRIDSVASLGDRDQLDHIDLTAGAMQATSAISTGLNDQTENYCEKCRVKFTDAYAHYTSVGHQVQESHIDPPVESLNVKKSHIGHKYLVRYGWEPLQREGLGMQGREGRRLPVKVHPRQNKMGIGGKINKSSANDASKKPLDKKPLSRSDIEKQREHDRKARQALTNEICL